MSVTKLWLLIHVATASTARGSRDVKSRKPASCSLIGIRMSIDVFESPSNPNFSHGHLSLPKHLRGRRLATFDTINSSQSVHILGDRNIVPQLRGIPSLLGSKFRAINVVVAGSSVNGLRFGSARSGGEMLDAAHKFIVSRRLGTTGRGNNNELSPWIGYRSRRADDTIEQRRLGNGDGMRSTSLDPWC